MSAEVSKLLIGPRLDLNTIPSQLYLNSSLRRGPLRRWGTLADLRHIGRKKHDRARDSCFLNCYALLVKSIKLLVGPFWVFVGALTRYHLQTRRIRSNKDEAFMGRIEKKFPLEIRLLSLLKVKRIAWRHLPLFGMKKKVVEKDDRALKTIALWNYPPRFKLEHPFFLPNSLILQFSLIFCSFF